MHLSSAPNTTANYNNADFLYFSGTSYLGVNLLPEFHKSLIQSLKKWGTSYGSSRSANIKLDIYQKGEQYLSSFLQTEDAVTVSSGTLASQFAIKAIKSLVEQIYYMPKTHPSILPKESNPVFDGESINTSLLNNPPKDICIVVDAIAALETDPFSFEFLKEIPTSTTIHLLVDESHSLGVLGKNGSGISVLIPSLKNLNLIIVSSLGKAFGISTPGL
jgi:7-keto-8-aminopelargonate synthetase-like enzyme